MSQKLQCQYEGQCSGCPFIHLSLEDQKLLKLEKLNLLLGKNRKLDIHWVDCGLDECRDRADMTFVSGPPSAMGLYGIEKKEIIDLEVCAIQTKSLANWYAEFRNFTFPINFGSFRLRVSPEGLKGVWLDFSNLAVKELFDEKKTLMKLLEVAHVEIGQRRKVLKLIDGQLKLTDPEPKAWFQTFVGTDLKPLSLFCSIGDFTQPSIRTNRIMIGEFFNQLKGLSIESVAEVGAGIGNFSLPLASRFKNIKAYELDKNSFASLNYNVDKSGYKNIDTYRGDVFKSYDYAEIKPDLLFVDPPRSGFHRFFSQLLGAGDLPRYISYISCFPESYAKDLEVIQSKYKLKKLSVVDQFPHSQHMELISLFERA